MSTKDGAVGTLGDRDRQKLIDLLVEFAWRVDHGLAGSIHQIVTDDIVMALTKGTMNGIEEVRAWGAKRDSTGRTTSHLMTNFRFSVVSEDRVEANSSALIFVHSGPGVGPAKPWAVTEYQDIFIRVDGDWKFKSRFSTDVFMSDDD